MTQNIVERRIMWGDLDPLGIVFYPRYYEWMDACGNLFFEAIGMEPQYIMQERKVGFPLVETSATYHNPGRYHQNIHILTAIESLAKKVLVLKHRIEIQSNAELLVEGLEKRICTDLSNPQNLRAINIPEDIYAILRKAQDDFSEEQM